MDDKINPKIKSVQGICIFVCLIRDLFDYVLIELDKYSGPNISKPISQRLFSKLFIKNRRITIIIS